MVAFKSRDEVLMIDSIEEFPCADPPMTLGLSSFTMPNCQFGTGEFSRINSDPLWSYVRTSQEQRAGLIASTALLVDLWIACRLAYFRFRLISDELEPANQSHHLRALSRPACLLIIGNFELQTEILQAVRQAQAGHRSVRDCELWRLQIGVQNVERPISYYLRRNFTGDHPLPISQYCECLFKRQ